MRCRLLAPLALGVLACAAPAHASTASLATVTAGSGPERCDQYGVCRSESSFSYARLVVGGKGDEENEIRVLAEADEVVVEDRAAPIRALGGCEQEETHRVRCEGRDLISVRVAAGRGDDSFRMALPQARILGAGVGRVHAVTLVDARLGAGDDRARVVAGRASVHGDAGDDRIATGAGRDTLLGGPGDDVLAAGPGRDVLLAAEARSPVGDLLLPPELALGSALRPAAEGESLPAEATPTAPKMTGRGGRRRGDVFDGGAAAGDFLSFAGARSGVRVDLHLGRADEHVVRGVEGVQGTIATDVIAGDGRRNFLVGDVGGLSADEDEGRPRPRDLLMGRGGDDVLQDAARFWGGAGNDVVRGFPEMASRVDCGAGHDVVLRPRRSARLRRCETSRTPGAADRPVQRPAA